MSCFRNVSNLMVNIKFPKVCFGLKPYKIYTYISPTTDAGVPNVGVDT